MANIYDKASLVMIPSGTKASKIFSQKPVNGDGDFTFSRSTAATRVNADGNIEKETQNLLTYSNAFTSGDWQDTGASYFTSGQSGYDGTNDAWLYTNAVYTERIQLTISKTGVHTLSAYFKKGTAEGMRMRVDMSGTDANLYVNLNDGSQITATGEIATEINDIGSGWYRVSLTANWINVANIRIYATDASGVIVQGSFYIQDAQLEQGLVARDYIETTTAAVEGGITDNVPRLDYTDSSCPALLLEPQRTNLVYQSEYLGAWSAANCTLTANSITSPEGVVNSFKITENSAASTQHRVSLGGIGGSSATYTMSAYVKNSSGTRMAYIDMGPVTAHFNFSTETMYSAQGTADWEDAGDGWYRIWVTSNSAISVVTAFAGLSVNNNETYSGDGTSAIEFYGIQLEAGSYPTSYIPTYGTSVTRNQCFANKTGVSSLIGQTEGTLFLDFKLPKIATPQNHTWVALKDSAQNNRVLVYFLANSETLRAQIKASGSTENFNLGTISNGDRVKIAIAYKSGDSAIYVNGSSSATSASALSFGTMDIIDFTDSSSPFEGDANEMLVFPTRLSNEELAALTTI